MLLDKRLRSFREGSVEGPTQTFIGRKQDDYVSFIGTKVQQWMMKVFVSSLCQFAQHFHHLVRKRTSSDHASLSFAAETIFMALVICCVFLTDLMRRRMSKRFGIVHFFVRQWERLRWSLISPERRRAQSTLTI